MIEIPGRSKIVLYGPALVNVVSSPVEGDEYDQLPHLYTYMRMVMRLFNGVGIAAPQVGIFKQYALVERLDGTVMEIVNPEITRMYGKEVDGFEACLSIPPYSNGCMVSRIDRIDIEYETRKSLYSRIGATLAGRDAVVAQHEIDHMTGTFFIDRAAKAAKIKVLMDYQKHQQKERNYFHAENHSRPQPHYCV